MAQQLSRNCKNLFSDCFLAPGEPEAVTEDARPAEVTRVAGQEVWSLALVATSSLAVSVVSLYTVLTLHRAAPPNTRTPQLIINIFQIFKFNVLCKIVLYCT